MIKNLQFKSLLTDRGYLASLVAMVVLTIIVVIVAIIYVHPGELRVPVRYSRFDAKNYSLDQWYYLLNYVIFAVIALAAHTVLSAKLYQVKGRVFALGFVSMGITVLFMTIVFFLAIVKVVSLSQ